MTKSNITIEQVTMATVRAVPVRATKDGEDIAVAVVLLGFGSNCVNLLGGFVDHLSDIHNQRTRSR